MSSMRRCLYQIPAFSNWSLYWLLRVEGRSGRGEEGERRVGVEGSGGEVSVMVCHVRRWGERWDGGAIFRQNVYLLTYTHVQMHEHNAIATHKSCTSAGTAYCVVCGSRQRVMTHQQTYWQTRHTTAVLGLWVINLMKDVFISTVVCFEDGILGAAGGGLRVMWPDTPTTHSRWGAVREITSCRAASFVQGNLKGAVGKVMN